MPRCLLAFFPSVSRALSLAMAVWLLCLLPAGLLAQDGDSNPTGNSGGAGGEVNTAGSYNPYTGNARRVITDLAVPGSNGAYPLVFARIFNSREVKLGDDFPYFGNGVPWRHSYQWNISPESDTENGPVVRYTVAYPDGAVVTYRLGRASAPPIGVEPYWRGPIGTTDRLEVQDSTHRYLHLSDGGIVCFDTSANPNRPSKIIDPHRAMTLFSYTSGQHLLRVTEPGGRWIELHYTTAMALGVTTSFLDYIVDNCGRTVKYTIDTEGTYLINPNVPSAGYLPYYGLQKVEYQYEPLVNGSGNVTAEYDNQGDPVNGYTPTLITCKDPHYGGAMVNIRYKYDPSNGVVGKVLEEQNFGTSQMVSKLIRDDGNNISTETRGDGPGRTFSYGEPTNVVGGITNAAHSQITTSTDYRGNKQYTLYRSNSATDKPFGRGYVAAVRDALGSTTQYETEELTGRVTKVTTPAPQGSYTRSATWGGDANNFGNYYLQSTIDERGQTTLYKRRSATGLVNEIDYPDNSKVTIDYLSLTASPGNTNVFYKPLTVTDQRGAVTTYEYNNHLGKNPSYGGCNQNVVGLLTSVTRDFLNGNGTPKQEFTRLYYDSLDRLSKVEKVGVNGVVSERFTYYAGTERITRVTHGDAAGSHVDYTYDDLGNLTKVTDELGHIVSRTDYDEYRRVIAAFTPVNDGNPDRVAAYCYDRWDAACHKTATALSHTSSLWGMTWTNSSKGVHRVYDENNWVRDEYAGINAAGSPAAPVHSAGFLHTGYDYNSLGQVISTVDPQGEIWTRTYDICRRPQMATDPLGHTTQWKYYNPGDKDTASSTTDCSGLLKELITPGTDLTGTAAGTATTRYSNYDIMARSTQIIDPAGHSTASLYAAGGDLLIQGDGAQTSLGPGLPHTTNYDYDTLGRLTSITHPDGTTQAWDYGKFGSLVSYKNRAGSTCVLQYDSRNRLSRKDWNDTPQTSYTSWVYDVASRVTEIHNANSGTYYTYDDAGRVQTEKESTAGQPFQLTRYDYDIDGNVADIVYPNTQSPSYGYDNLQRCTSVSWSGNVCAQYTYVAGTERLTGRWLGNNLYTGYDYQDNGRCQKVSHYHATGPGGVLDNTKPIEQDNTYGFLPDGQISWNERRFRVDGVQDYRGDRFVYELDGSLKQFDRDAASSNWPANWNNQDSRALYGLISGGGPTASQNVYNYDQAGNRTTTTTNGSSSGNYVPDQENRYTGGIFTHDPNSGNVTSVVATGWNFTYDAENQLLSATKGTTDSITFRYDGLGRLVRRTVNGVVSYFCYAGSQRVEERNASNQVLSVYCYETPGSDSALFRLGGAVGRIWYQRDLLGNTTHIYDDAGNVLEKYLYDAWGKPTIYDATGMPTSGNVSAYDNRYLWNGDSAYEWLSGPALYHCRARYYIPQYGRFLQADPIGQMGGLNIYAYCDNDPINTSDPSGYSSPKVDSSHDDDNKWHIPDGSKTWTGSDGRQHYGVERSDGGWRTYTPPSAEDGGRIVVDAPLNDAGLRFYRGGDLILGPTGGQNGGSGEAATDQHGTRNFFMGVTHGFAREAANLGRAAGNSALGNLGVFDPAFDFADDLLDSTLSNAADSGNSVCYDIGNNIGHGIGIATTFAFGGPEVRAVESADITYLYQKLGPAGEHLKFGITKSPSTRYTSGQLAGGKLNIIARGVKSEMLRLERHLHGTLPIGPEERQSIYIQIQVNKGLKAPPY